jgi:hypothetical protein
LHPGEIAGANSIIKIAPPTLPGELVAGSAPNRVRVGSGFTPGPGQDLYPPTRQLGVLVTHSLPDTSSNLDVTSRSNNWERSAAHGSSGDGYRKDSYVYPSGADVPQERLISSSAAVSSPHSATSDHPLLHNSHSDSQYPLVNVSNTILVPDVDTGSVALLTHSLDTTGGVGVASSLSLPRSATHIGPPSPTFSRLQHTHDPHFRPPTDVFAGLAYPRGGMAVPALGRGGSDATAGELGLGTTADARRDSSNRVQSRFQVTDEYSYPHGKLGRVAERAPDQGMLAKALAYTTEASHSGISADSYSRDSTGEMRYRGSSEDTYSDYSTSAQPSGRYITQSSSSSLTTPISHYGPQEDTGSSYTESVYASSADSVYTPQTDRYSPDIQTPAEITVLPPPADQGLLNFWRDGASGSMYQYDNSVSGSGYISGVSSSSIHACHLTDEPRFRYAVPLAIPKLALRTSEREVLILDPASKTDLSVDLSRSTVTEDEDRVRTLNEFSQHLYHNGSGGGYGAGWVSEPSVAFARKTWWDNLLETYAPTTSEAYAFQSVYRFTAEVGLIAERARSRMTLNTYLRLATIGCLS